MTELTAHECVLTPEQRRRLGQVYRLILSWRREHNKVASTPATEQPIEGKAPLLLQDLDPFQLVEGRS